jgi:hypothetical protein
MLLANLWFLMLITQTGLSFANMVSLINGLFFLPRILVQGLLAWFRQSSDESLTDLPNDMESSRDDLTRYQSESGYSYDELTFSSAVLRLDDDSANLSSA